MTEDEIDDIIDRWHEGNYPGLELWEVLGWTPEQYKRWVETCEIPR